MTAGGSSKRFRRVRRVSLLVSPVLAVVLFVSLAAAAIAADDARQIVEEVQRRTDATSQSLRRTAAGVRRQRPDERQALVVRAAGIARSEQGGPALHRAAEVKGVALLVVNHPDRASDQWMWTPAIERDRRIALQDRSTGFFGHRLQLRRPRRAGRRPVRVHRVRRRDGRRPPAGRFESTPRQSKVSRMPRDRSSGSARTTTVSPDRELRQGSGGAAAELLRSRTCRGCGRRGSSR